MNIRRLTSILSAVSALAVCSGLAVGCAATGEEPTSSASQSQALTIIEADEALGKLVARFAKDGREVTFELRLGPKMQEPPTDPKHPSYEVDARVLDAEGQVFHMQMGGDTFLDASWPARPKIVDVDAEVRDQDRQRAVAAEAAFATAQIPASLEQLRLAAMDIARGLENTAEHGKKIGATPVSPNDGHGTLAPKIAKAGAGYWDYRVYKKTAAVIANHSAVRARAFSSAKAWLADFNSCNHGTCAGGSAMESYCTYSGWLADDGTSSRYFYSEPSTSTGSVTGGCTTLYGVLSGSGLHNCNDDSRLQKKAVTYDNSYCTNCNDDCGNSLSDAWAPSCD